MILLWLAILCVPSIPACFPIDASKFSYRGALATIPTNLKITLSALIHWMPLHENMVSRVLELRTMPKSVILQMGNDCLLTTKAMCAQSQLLSDLIKDAQEASPTEPLVIPLGVSQWARFSTAHVNALFLMNRDLSKVIGDAGYKEQLSFSLGVANAADFLNVKHKLRWAGIQIATILEQLITDPNSIQTIVNELVSPEFRDETLEKADTFFQLLPRDVIQTWLWPKLSIRIGRFMIQNSPGEVWHAVARAAHEITIMGFLKRNLPELDVAYETFVTKIGSNPAAVDLVNRAMDRISIFISPYLSNKLLITYVEREFGSGFGVLTEIYEIVKCMCFMETDECFDTDNNRNPACLRKLTQELRTVLSK